MLKSRVSRTQLKLILATMACGALASPANADRLMLATGETLHVSNIVETDGIVRFTHPVLGDMQLPRTQIRAIEPDQRTPGQFEQLAALGALQDDAVVDTGTDEAEWAGNFTLAGSLTEGNTESINVTSIVRITRDTRRMATRFDVGYFYGSNSGDRNENRFTAGIINDWIIDDSPWSVFATARYDFDEFQSWDYRISAHGGVGYQLVDRENYQLKLRAGLGVIKEFNSNNDDWRPEALFGVEGAWQISERQSLTYDATIYPDLSDGGEFRTIENVAWRLLLDEETSLSLTAGLQHEHQSEVDPGRKRNDFRAYVGLSIDF